MRLLKKGFTLIELLVVIAIIGILASIVLVALNGGRDKSRDATIQSDLQTMRKQSELYITNNNVYGTNAVVSGTAAAGCGTVGMWTDPTIILATKGAANVGGTPAALNGTTNPTVCGSSGNSWWFFAATLRTDPTKVWCVDSNGKSESMSIGTYFDTAAHAAAQTGCQ